MTWPFPASFWAKPQKLEAPCTICTRSIPYDPTNTICSDCSYQANIDMAQVSSNSMSAYKTQNNYQPYPLTTPASSLKRSAESPAQEEYPSKRTFSNGYGVFNNPLIRRTVVGPATPTYASPPVVANDEPRETFRDTKEDLPSMVYRQNVYHDDDELHDYGDSGFMAKESDYWGKMAGSASDIDHNAVMEIDDEADGEEEEEPDLFHNTFGPRRSQDSEDEDDDMESANSDDDEIEEEEKEAASCKQNESNREGDTNTTIKKAADTTKNEFLTQQNITNLGLVGDKQPGSTVSRSTTLPLTGPRDPDPEKDLSHNLREFEKFKNKAVELIPQLPLSEHRYWIGVLHENVKAKNIKNETDFIWMKSNRLTTVSTVWHTYSTTTASEGFVLLLGYERPELTVRMEELDYFSEKKIIFRAINENSSIARGREMCEGLIPPEVVVQGEVIELD